MWRRWVAFLAEDEPAIVLALLRIAFSCCAFATIASVVVHGLVLDLWVDPRHGGMIPPGSTPQLALLGGPSPRIVVGATALSLASSALFALGLGGRVVGFVALQSFLAVSALNGTAGCSYTLLISNALWLLVLSDSTATLSLDCRRRTGRFTSEARAPSWPRRLMVFQLVVVYFSAGIHKVSAYWTPGGDFSAVYYILRAPNWSRVHDGAWLADVFPLTQAATAATWLFEWTAPLLLVALWWRRRPGSGGALGRAARRFDPRVPFAAVGIGMHVGIELTMTVGPFSAASIAYYLALLHPRELPAIVRWFRARVSGRADPA